MQFRVLKFPGSSFAFEHPEFKEKLGGLYKIAQERGFDFFRSCVSRCSSCHLRQEGQVPVLPEGSVKSLYVFVGRNPGRKENKFKRPFFPSAPSGAHLGRIFDRLRVRREQTYITNACFCYGENDRAPLLGEKTTCLLWKGIEFNFLEASKYIFLLGTDALFPFFGSTSLRISSVVGTLWEHRTSSGEEKVIIPLYHPSHILRNPSLESSHMVLINGIREYITARESR